MNRHLHNITDFSITFIVGLTIWLFIFFSVAIIFAFVSGDKYGGGKSSFPEDCDMNIYMGKPICE